MDRTAEPYELARAAFYDGPVDAPTLDTRCAGSVTF